MGRIRLNIEINRKKLWTLFDSGSRNTYINKVSTIGLPITPLNETRFVSLGGKDHSLKRICFLIGKINGKSIETEAYVLDSIGKDEDGNEIEILFGALAMQKWGIRLNLKEEILDMSHYSKEFIEY